MGWLKDKLLKLYYLPCLKKGEIEKNQTIIRDIEWQAVLPFINEGASFLDVGCGASHAMKRAIVDKKCIVTGVDPEPGAHGPGRYSLEKNKGLNVIQGFSERLPFNDEAFDVIFCSHVLEHVDDVRQSLFEMNRVLKDDGVLIIGVPTATMALIGLFTNLLFTTHMRFVNFFFKPFINTGGATFKNVFLPPSHSFPVSKTVLFDIKNYQIRKWKKLIGSFFHINQVIQPALYPFPEYLQLFNIRKNIRLGSSAFFIVKKKKL